MARKNANGEGTIYPRKNKNGKITGYRASYWVQTPQGQKRRYISAKKREDVAKKLRKILHDMDSGLFVDAGPLTVEEYLIRWLKESMKDTVRTSTHQRYEQIVRLHLVQGIGHLKLKDLAPGHVQRLYRDRLDSGLSSGTVRKSHNVLHKALSQAMRWGLVPRNVTELTDPPRENPKEVNPLSPEEAHRLLEAAQGNPLEALYVLAVHTGMREGELLALKWDDVDLDNGVVNVNRTLTKDKGRLLFGETKSAKGRRRVDLTNAAVESLRNHVSRQMDDIARLGDLYQDQGLVFTTYTGAPINPSNLRQRSLAKLLKKAGLRKIRFHDLRHTCATLLLRREVHPKFVQELLGHANVEMTLGRYSHFSPGMGRRTAQAMEEIFS
ncbi:MAG: site-specific integrase [Rubrobacteraceae bacterium]